MKIQLTFLLWAALSLSSYAQKRNMIPNGDFESPSNNESAGWTLGSGMYLTETSGNDKPIRGDYSLCIDGKTLKSNSQFTVQRPFTVSKDEKYRLKFKAYCTGTSNAVVEPYIACHYGNGHLPGENLFNSQTITVPCDGKVREYALDALPINQVGMGNNLCDYTLFILDFAQMQGWNSRLVIDDIQLIRIDPYGEAMGNIKTNPEFTDLLSKYWFYTERGNTASTVKEGDHTIVQITLNPTTIIPPKTGYSCFTGSSVFWKEHETRNWEIRITVDADFTTPDAKLFVNGDSKVFSYLVPRESITGTTGTGGYTFELKEGLHTYIFNYTSKDKGGAFNPGYVAGELLLDLNFGTAESGTASIHSFYMIEKVELTALTLHMPETIAVGQTVPVDVWATPTHANNQVTLSVSNDNGSITRDENGVWQYTQLKAGECTLTATSTEKPSITSTLTVVNSAAPPVPVDPTEPVAKTRFLRIELKTNEQRDIPLRTISQVTFSNIDMTLTYKDKSQEKIAIKTIQALSFITDNGTDSPCISEESTFLYHNPSAHSILLEDIPEGVDRISIYAMTGEMVMNIQAISSSQSIDISALQEGMYLLKLNDQVFKFTKQ